MPEKRIGFALEVKTQGLTRGLSEASGRFKQMQEAAQNMPNLSQKIGTDGEFQEGIKESASSVGDLGDQIEKLGRAIDRVSSKMKRMQAPKGGGGSLVATNFLSAFGADKKQRGIGQQERDNRKRLGTIADSATNLSVGKGAQSASGLLGGIPIIGQALGFGLNQYAMGAQEFARRRVARRGAESVLGDDSRGLRGIAGRMVGRGFSRAETFQQAGMFSRQAGGLGGFERSMQLQRAYGLGAGTTGQMASTERQFGRGGITQLQSALVKVIETGPFPRALSQELASASTSFLQSSGSLGAASSGSQALGLISNLSKQLGGRYGRSPQATGGLLSRVGAGIQSSFAGGDQSRQAQAYFALKSQNPNMSFARIMRETEKGATEKNVNAFLARSRSMFPGDQESAREQRQQYLSRVLGVSQTEGYKLAGLRSVSGNVAGSDKDASTVLSERAKRANQNMGLVQRNLTLNEQRANMAQAADKGAAKLDALQLAALKGLTTTINRLTEVLQNPTKFTANLASQIANAIKGFFGFGNKNDSPNKPNTTRRKGSKGGIN